VFNDPELFPEKIKSM